MTLIHEQNKCFLHNFYSNTIQYQNQIISSCVCWPICFRNLFSYLRTQRKELENKYVKIIKAKYVNINVVRKVKMVNFVIYLVVMGSQFQSPNYPGIIDSSIKKLLIYSINIHQKNNLKILIKMIFYTLFSFSFY